MIALPLLALFLAADPPPYGVELAEQTIEYLSRPGTKATERDAVLAEKLAETTRKKKDPFRDLRGDLHLAYRSAADDSLQPFRLYIPRSYKPNRPTPLIVALHGVACDENWYFDRFAGESGAFTRMAEERGYLAVAPNGRGPVGGYVGLSERDVLDVMEAVARVVSVDPRNVFLTGHSMGGGGTWAIGFRHPERFKALAPVAGAFGLSLLPLSKAPEMPVLHYHGTKDHVIPEKAARLAALVAAARLRNYRFELVPGAGHLDITDIALKPIFDFFDAHRTR